MAKEKVQPIKPKDEKRLPALIVFINITIGFYLILILYQVYNLYPKLSGQIPWVYLTNIISLFVEIGLLILCQKFLIQGQQKALWIYISAFGFLFGYNMLISLLVVHSLNPLSFIGLIISGAVIAELIILRKKGILN
jgi:hypothetical protein